MSGIYGITTKKVISISIIVPIYQAEKYLYDNLKSLIRQNLTNYEIICIDDGSTDASAKIIHDFMVQYPIIKYYYQRNNGVSAARNLGLSKAQGEYIMFVDADDSIKSNSLRGIYRKAKKTNADILVFGGRTDNLLLTPEWVKSAFYTKNRTYIGNSETALFSENGARPSVCNKVFRKKIITDCLFPIHISISEDLAFLFMVFPKSNIIVFSSRCIYCYRLTNESSAMHTIEKNTLYFFENHLCTVEYIMKEWKKAGFLYKQLRFLREWAVSFLEYIYKELDNNQKEVYKKRLETVSQTLHIPYSELIQELNQVHLTEPFSIKKLYLSIKYQYKMYGFFNGCRSIVSKILTGLRGYIK